MAEIFRPPIIIRIPKLPSQFAESFDTNNPLLTPNPSRPFAQSDWAPTIRARQPHKSDAPANLLPILGKLPFNVSEWRLPARGRAPIFSESFETNNPLLTPNPSMPFGLDAWPRPCNFRVPIESDAPANLLPISSVVVAATPFSADLWPRPAVSPKAVPSDVQGTLLPQGTLPFSADLWPKPARPLFTVPAECFELNNPLLTPNPSAPFSAEDWPTTSNPKLQPVTDVVANFLPLRAVAPAGTPFIPTDWASPARLLTPAKARWLGNQPVFEPDAPFVQTDWPLATTARFLAPPDVSTNRLPLGVVVAAAPFSQDDWPNATNSKFPALATDFSASLPLIAPNPAQPFSASDWSLTATPRPTAQPFDTINLLPQGGVAAPFSQTDWPSTARNVSAIVVDGQGTFLPQGTLPFSLEDWPSAAGARRLPKPDWHVNLLSILAPNPAQPFTVNDWPATAGARRAAQPFDAVNLLPQGSVVAAPFTVNDWPSVARAARGTPSDWQANVLPHSTMPFGTDLWPRPARIRTTPADWHTNLLALLQPNQPFSLEDWGSPALAKRPGQPSDPANLLPLSSVVVVFPFSQEDWPNAAIPKRAVTLPDQFVRLPIAYPEPPPAPFAQMDWNMPKPRQAASHTEEVYWNFLDYVPPIPGPSIDYQGDGKKRRRRRNKTHEMFDRLENTLRALVYGESSPQSATSPRVEKALEVAQESVDGALAEMAKLAATDAALQQRFDALQANFLAYVKRIEEEDEDDDFLMMH